MSETNSSPKNEKKGEKQPKFPPVWLYIIILLVLLGLQFMYFQPDADSRIEYSTFLNHVKEGNVKRIVIKNGIYIYGEYKDEAMSKIPLPPQNETSPLQFQDAKKIPSNKFTTTMIAGDDIRPLLEEHNVQFDARIEENWMNGVFSWILPIALIVVFWLFIFKKMNPGQQVLNIGKNKAALYDKQSENKVTFKDVAGLEEAKEEVEEIVEFLRHPEKFTRLGGTIPKGVLLVGPPGTGKTLMAKATAGEADVPFFSLSGSDFVEMFVGVGAARVRDLFKQAKEKAPCIIFIDEIDAVGRSRGKGMMMGANDERENTLNQLLAEMDGFGSDKSVIIMAATNRPDVLDSALLRPGRFDRQILIDKPDLIGRIEVLKVHTKKLKMSELVDIRILASQTPGFAGAELANLCNEAALIAARQNKESVEMIDFTNAIERVVAGLEKKNKIISPNEREIVAYHESGHAIVGWFLEHTDPVLKVSIVPRGLSALGYTLQTPLEDRFLMTKEELYDKICALLGGRIAEEIIFGKISTGAQNDLERITNMAFAMVAVYGMSEELGYVSYYDSSNPEGSFGINKKYSDQTAQRIDKAIKQIIDDARISTKDLLLKHKDKLELMAKTLLEKEKLDPIDLLKLLGERPHGKYPVSLDELAVEAKIIEEIPVEKVKKSPKDEEVEQQNVTTESSSEEKMDTN